MVFVVSDSLPEPQVAKRDLERLGRRYQVFYMQLAPTGPFVDGAADDESFFDIETGQAVPGDVAASAHLKAEWHDRFRAWNADMGHLCRVLGCRMAWWNRLRTRPPLCKISLCRPNGMPFIGAEAIYPPLVMSGGPAAAAMGALVVAVAGFYAVRWWQRRAVGRARVALSVAQKQDQDKLIERTLKEIEAVRGSVASGTLPASEGALRVSLLTRGCVDSVKQYDTVFRARFEMARKRMEKCVT